MFRRCSTTLVVIAACSVLASSAGTERWYADPQRWAESPVGKALHERAQMEGRTFSDHRESGDSGSERYEHREWNRRIQEALQTLTDADAERRVRCFAAAQGRAVATLARPHAPSTSQTEPYVVLVSGSTVLSGGSASKGSVAWRGSGSGMNDLVRDIALSKKAYAQRHAYEFEYYGAEHFIDSLERARLPRWEFAKTFMLREAWMKHEKDGGNNTVLMWSDYDVWLNPRHASLPVSVYASEALRVSPDTVVVLGPEAGLNTGFFLWRMTTLGRRMLFNWHQLVVSGVAECHGYDQAAFQILTLNEHLRRQPNRSTIEAAVSYTGCKQPACGGGDNGFKEGVGCNARYFEAVKHLLGQAGVKDATGHEIDNGLANHLFPLVHVLGKASPRLPPSPSADVTRDTALPPRPPRMQCGSQFSLVCTRSDFFAAHKCFRSFYRMYVDMFGCNISTDLSVSRVGAHFGWHGANEEPVWLPSELDKAFRAQLESQVQGSSR